MTKATNIANRTSIHDRPKEADGSRYGDWEMDTIVDHNGCEFAAHLKISDALSFKGLGRIIVYFTDSYSSWQKGAIENANKLIRRYIPKGTDFKNISNKKIKTHPAHSQRMTQRKTALQFTKILLL